MRARRRHRRILVLSALLSLLAAGAFVACDSGEESKSAGAGRDDPGAIGRPMTATIPAQIDPRPQTFVSQAVVRPTNNAWRTASREHMTEVDAGALATDGSTGALAIFRHDFLAVSQDVNVVKVKNSGPLRITKGPIGKGVEESAQRNGEIEFVGGRGVRGTLHLNDDSVTLEGRLEPPSD